MNKMYCDKERNISMFSCGKLWVFALISIFCSCNGASYQNMTQLFRDKLGSKSGYQTNVRPLLDQAKIIEVKVKFDVVAILEIDAKKQQFLVNGFLSLFWNDEIVRWNPAEYNDIYLIHPEPKQIWRPRLILTNTVEQRDLFEDDYCPTSTAYDGNTSWHPGSLFPTSCKLNLYKYPFDEQDCYIELYSMGWTIQELEFTSLTGEVGKNFYTESGEWEITDTILMGHQNIELPYFKMDFKLRRLPGFFIVNIVIPIVLMSFLNILVFIIPVDSGEKISYGITVLLALTVFMSIVSEQLPKSSDTLPLMTIYLLVLTLISVCTVIVSIAIVFFHHREEKETRHQKASSMFKSLFRKINLINRAGEKFAKVQVKPTNVDRRLSNSSTSKDDHSHEEASNTKTGQETIYNILNDLGDKMNKKSSNQMDVDQERDRENCNYVNRWKQFGQHLDGVSFIVFTCIWFSVTIGFLVEISR